MNFNLALLNDAQRLLDLALQKNIKIATAESCTGGLLSALITEISGSSKIFDRGFVVYSNEAKMENLGVEQKTLNDFGAVSSEVAEQMAIGAIKNSNANLSIAITGIAEKINGASDEKPAGLVYISSFNNVNKKLIVEKFNFVGSRNEIRNLGVKSAVGILIKAINDL